MKRTYTFNLDIRRCTPVRIKGIVNGETGNEFVFTLTDNGEKISLAQNANLVAVFHRSDGEIKTFTTGISISLTGVVTLTVSNTAFTAGKNTFEVRVMNGSNVDVTTQQVEFVVRSKTEEPNDTQT